MCYNFFLDVFKASHAVNCFPCIVLCWEMILFVCFLLLNVTHRYCLQSCTHSSSLPCTYRNARPSWPSLSVCVPIYQVVSVCLLNKPCLCVLGLFVPCGPAMQCPPPLTPQPMTAILPYSAPLYVLYALERVHKRRLTWINPPWMALGR